MIDAVEGVVAWDAVEKLKIPAEPFFFGHSEFLHVPDAFAATDDGTQGDEEDVGEVVIARALDPWIFQFPENENDGWKRGGVGFVWRHS